MTGLDLELRRIVLTALRSEDGRAVVAEVVSEIVSKLPTVAGPDEVTIREAAQHRGCTERTIRRQLKSGALPCRRVGRAVHIRRGDL